MNPTRNAEKISSHVLFMYINVMFFEVDQYVSSNFEMPSHSYTQQKHVFYEQIEIYIAKRNQRAPVGIEPNESQFAIRTLLFL